MYIFEFAIKYLKKWFKRLYCKINSLDKNMEKFKILFYKIQQF